MCVFNILRKSMRSYIISNELLIDHLRFNGAHNKNIPKYKIWIL